MNWGPLLEFKIKNMDQQYRATSSIMKLLKSSKYSINQCLQYCYFKSTPLIANQDLTFVALCVCVFCLGLLETKATAVTGTMGQEITITCSHSNAYSNVKYFCRDPCENRDILIKSSEEKSDSNRKYSIKDKGNTFAVTISDLNKDDSGIYWCGIERVGVDTYNQVNLKVLGELIRCFTYSFRGVICSR